MSDIDTRNRQFVGWQADEVVVMMPRGRMSRREALVHAAWLVAVAGRDDEFPAILEAVRST